MSSLSRVLGPYHVGLPEGDGRPSVAFFILRVGTF